MAPANDRPTPADDHIRESRVAALRALVELSVEPGAAITAVGRFGWDFDEELVVLTPKDLIRMLNMYLSGKIAADDWRLWAQALEGRDDVGVDEESSRLIEEFIFQSATPEIFEPLTPSLANRWLTRLARIPGK